MFYIVGLSIELHRVYKKKKPNIYRTDIKVCLVGAIFKLMKSPKAFESASRPLLVALAAKIEVVEVVVVCLDSFRSAWTLEDFKFVTAAEFDCRCEENVSLMVVRCSDGVAMSREAWKRSRF